MKRAAYRARILPLSVFGKLFTAAAVIFLVFLSFYKAMVTTEGQEPLPAMEPMDLKVFRKYADYATAVNVYCTITSVEKFSPEQNNFELKLLLSFEYKGERLPAGLIENFTLENGKILEKRKISVTRNGDMTVAWYSIVARFSSPMNFSRFPVDNHTVSVIFGNTEMTPAEGYLYAVQENFSIAKGVSFGDWRVLRGIARYGVGTSRQGGKDSKITIIYPKVSFSLVVRRSGIRKLAVMLTPILLVFIIILLSLVLHTKNSVGRIATSSSGVGALLGYRFVIEKMSPHVSYFTLIDRVYFVLLFGGFLLLSYNLVSSFILSVNAGRPDYESVVRRLQFSQDLFFYVVAVLTTGAILYAVL